jgi:cyclomaltodextrinase / maltogenic alpha-amylase / neopullulanase
LATGVNILTGAKRVTTRSYNARKPTADQRQRQKLIIAFQMLYLGSPMFFYGDEAGMWGANDPDCRKPMVWAENKYDAEIYNPNQSKHEPDEVNFDQEIFNWYKKFTSLRKKYKSIRVGSYTTLTTDDANKLYAFSRKLGEEEVIVILNRSSKPVTFSHATLKTKKFNNISTGLPVKKEIQIQPLEVIVLSNK